MIYLLLGLSLWDVVRWLSLLWRNSVITMKNAKLTVGVEV